MLDPSQLHVFTARSNPLHWTATHRNWLRFARGMLDAGVTLTVIECAFGEEDHRCAMPGVRHIPYREAPDLTLQIVADFFNRLLRDHREGEGRTESGVAVS